jgi:hypothetical protein
VDFGCTGAGRVVIHRVAVSAEVIALIRKMSQANPRWGAPRIHGELLKLGFELSKPTGISEEPWGCGPRH